LTGLGAAGLGMSSTSLAKLPKESEAEFNERMAWWREARFGMFIHWGIYSVPAGVWKGKRAEKLPAEWIMFEKQIPQKEYAKLAGRFNPVKFDAREWAKIARDAGMKYMVITAKHHDGFCMYHSKQTEYNIVDATPFKRDVIAELAEACAEVGVRFGLYYSVLDWTYSSYPYIWTAIKPRFGAYYKYMLEQVREILGQYGTICSLFFDGNWFPQWKHEHGAEVERTCRELQPGVVINDRLRQRGLSDLALLVPGIHPEYTAPEIGDYVTPEQFIPDEAPGVDWETCMTMNDSWGHRSWDNNWKSETEIIRNLADIASKGGNYLLNVGPTKEGTIPGPSISRLKRTGEWMDTNGEAIYGTKPGPVRDAPWGRTTRKDGKIYLHIFDWPEDDLQISEIKEDVKQAYVLTPEGHIPVPAKRIDGKLVVSLPGAGPFTSSSTVVLDTGL